MSALARIALLLGVMAGLLSGPALAGKSWLSGDQLTVPRIDVNGFGAMELSMRLVFDGEYRLLLEQALETSESVDNSGVFDAELLMLTLDEVELASGDRYAVELELLSAEPPYLFAINEAVALQDPAPKPSGAIDPAAMTLYAQQCANCHSEDGGGTTIGPALTACANCSSVSALASYIAATMPLGNSANCDASCAAMMADYLLAAFNQDNAQVVSQTVGFIELLDDQSTLRKAAQQLLSRLPSFDEQQLVASRGRAGLEQAINGMMDEDAFYERMSEIWNDYLLTDKYHSRNGSEAAINLLSSDEFPDRRWFDPGKDSRPDNYDELKIATNNAIAREPLELINYIVANNRSFTEILTADYMMLSPFSARSYGAQGLPFANPNDPNEFVPGRLEDMPHAGILTSPMFLNRYPTTSTNRNRGRARVVFDIFLDTDILAIEGVRPGNAVDITTPIPTINNPECSRCHTILDPVASTFQNWDYKGRYRPSRLSRDGWYTDMEARGFNGQSMPLAGNVDSSLRWLGQQIVADLKFPRAVSRIMVNGLTGKEPLKQPEDGASQAKVDAFVAERSVLQDIQARFVADGYNMKTMVREIIMSPYWRAAGITSQADIRSHAATGSNSLLTPEQLDRKVENLFGFDWRGSLDQYYKDKDSSWASKLNRTYHQIYGGIDSDSTVTRLRSPNGLMGAMQIRMANELACYSVPREFWRPAEQRRLMLFVDQQTNPYNEAGLLDESAMQLIRDNIQYLHVYLLGEVVSQDSAEFQITEQLFMNVINRGRQLILASGGEWSQVSLPDNCDVTRDFEGNDLRDVNGEDLRLREDRQYVIRAWMAVVAYLLADYRFFYG